VQIGASPSGTPSKNFVSCHWKKRGENHEWLHHESKRPNIQRVLI
jgi:hypothetical protein